MTIDRLFLVYDKVSEHTLLYRFAPTAGAFIRDNGSQLYQINPNFEAEYLLFEIGAVNDFSPTDVDSPFVSNLVAHTWDEYKKPEVKVTKSEPDEDMLTN